MSEPRNENDAQKMIDRKDSRQNNRWRQNITAIARRIKVRKVKSRQLRQERCRGNLFTKQCVKVKKVVRFRFREDFNQHQKLIRNAIQGTMETRTRARAVEELTAAECKDRDRKGKAIAKEEAPEEIYEIYDDSEEEDDLRELGRQSKERGGIVGDWDTQQTSEEQQGQRQERVRRYGRQRGGRGAGSRSKAGSKRGRAKSRSGGERGGRQGQRGRPAKKTRRSVEEKINQTDRAYS